MVNAGLPCFVFQPRTPELNGTLASHLRAELWHVVREPYAQVDMRIYRW